MLETLYSPAEPVSLSATLGPLRRGREDPTFRTDATGVWLTMATPLGSATLHLARRDGAFVATAWGEGAEWAISSVPDLLGRGDDWSGLDVSAHPLLADARHRNPGLRLTRTGRVFEMMLPAVLEQKVTGIEARRAWRWMLARHGEPAPGPAPAGMRVFPPASIWRRVPSWEWHQAGVGPQRSATIMRCSAVAESLERTLERSCGGESRGGPDVERALRSLPGVGVWTAAETMQRAHGDPDAVSVGDFHLARLVGYALIGEIVDDERMLELLTPWAGQRQRVVRLIEASGVSVPARGPRITVQDHRAI